MFSCFYSLFLALPLLTNCDLFLSSEKANDFLSREKRRVYYKTDELPEFSNGELCAVSQCDGYPLELRELKTINSNYTDAWYGYPKYIDLRDEDFTNEIINCLSPHGVPCQAVTVYLDTLKKPEMKNAVMYFTLYWRWRQCYFHKNTLRNCPNPCNSNPCHVIKSANRVCRPFARNDIAVDKLPASIQFLKPIFQYDYKCQCETGYHWVHKERRCKANGGVCKLGGQCHNNGECIEDASVEQLYRCLCKPAWTGAKCELRTNPCVNNDTVRIICGAFPCYRDEETFFGFRCGCQEKGHYRQVSHIHPGCVDVNECDMKPDPCEHNGKCVNINGTYRCQCADKYSGRNCEINLRQQEAKWAPWGPWSECSVPCGNGIRSAYRECNYGQYCSGEESISEPCAGKHCGRKQFDETEFNDKPHYKYNSSFIERLLMHPNSFDLNQVMQEEVKRIKGTAAAAAGGQYQNSLFIIFIIILVRLYP